MLVIIYSIVVNYITARKSKIIPENWELAWCSQPGLHFAKNKLLSLSWPTGLPAEDNHCMKQGQSVTVMNPNKIKTTP